MNHIRVTHEIQKEIGGRRLTKSPRYVFSDIIYNLYVYLDNIFTQARYI